MNKVLKLQRIGLMTPTAVEYKGKILATNQLDIESTCNLWRNHFGFYPTERVDLAMTEKDFSVIQQKPLASSKSVYELFCEQNFIPRVFEITEKFAEWGIYRNNEVDALKTENAALRERLEKLYDKKVIANMLARLFSCPCNFTPLDEEMFDYCNDDCVMEDAVCWERVIDKEMRGKEAEARLAEMKGEER